jgi:L-threonylcarbamoyladenylate synthase
VPTTPIRQADDAALAEAAAALRDGKLVAFPTETVYGLGADATNGRAVARIFEAKGRPSFNPLISHLHAATEACKYARLNDVAEALTAAFWPGPLTLVLPRTADCPIADITCAGLDTVALRVPAHPLARRLLHAAGCPVAAPSANRSGHISPTDAADVLAELDGRIDLILDGGRCTIGLESTVVDCSGREAVLLRPGGITAEQISAIVGPLATSAGNAESPNAPGQLASHYAPDKPLRLNASEKHPGEVLIGFGPGYPGDLNLSPSADLTEAAANLFHILREAEKRPARRIAVAPVPGHGLGAAINDRLSRAAAPR